MGENEKNKRDLGIAMLSYFFKRLLWLRQITFNEGEIKILGKNFFLFNLEEFVKMQEELKKEFGERGLKIIYLRGKSFSNSLIKTVKGFSKERVEIFENWINLLDLFGFGQIEVKSLEGKAYIQVNKNKFAENYVKIFGKQEKPIDYFLTGVFEEFFNFWFKKKVKCKENMCAACLNPHCEFIVS